MFSYLSGNAIHFVTVPPPETGAIGRFRLIIANRSDTEKKTTEESSGMLNILDQIVPSENAKNAVGQPAVPELLMAAEDLRVFWEIAPPKEKIERTQWKKYVTQRYTEYFIIVGG